MAEKPPSPHPKPTDEKPLSADELPALSFDAKWAAIEAAAACYRKPAVEVKKADYFDKLVLGKRDTHAISQDQCANTAADKAFEANQSWPRDEAERQTVMRIAKSVAKSPKHHR